jgi:hypothetical protein
LIVFPKGFSNLSASISFFMHRQEISLKLLQGGTLPGDWVAARLDYPKKASLFPDRTGDLRFAATLRYRFLEKLRRN